MTIGRRRGPSSGGAAIRGRIRLVFGAPGEARSRCSRTCPALTRAQAADWWRSERASAGRLPAPENRSRRSRSRRRSCPPSFPTRPAARRSRQPPRVRQSFGRWRVERLPHDIRANAHRLHADRAHSVGGGPRGDSARAPRPSRRAARGQFVGCSQAALAYSIARSSASFLRILPRPYQAVARRVPSLRPIRWSVR